MVYGDQNLGWCLIKYFIYCLDDVGKIELDYVLICLVEIYYYLVEICFYQGRKVEVEKLLNYVWKCYYLVGFFSLYFENGSVLIEQELLDEWGWEFLGEGLCRQILCRFGIFNLGIWWDKELDLDNYMMWIFFLCIILNMNLNLKQNLGYLFVN